MRKITFLSVLLLLLGWSNAWAQTRRLTPEELTNGKIVAIRAISEDNTNWIKVPGTGVVAYEPECAFELVYHETEQNKFALRNLERGANGYIQQPSSGTVNAALGGKDAAAWFTAVNPSSVSGTLAAGINATDATTIRLTTTVSGDTQQTHFNVNGSTSPSRFATGTGGWSVVNLYDLSEMAVYNIKPKIIEAGNLREGWDYLVKGAGGRSGWAFAGVAGENGELLKVFLNNTSDAVTTLSEKYVFNIEDTGDGFKLKTKDGKYVKIPDLVDSADDATVFSLSPKAGAEVGVWNLRVPGTYANMNAANTVTNPPSEANWVITSYWDGNDANGKWEIYPVNVTLPVYTVTYHIKDSHGNIVNTQTYQVIEGDSFPDVQYGVSSSDFYDTSAIPDGTVSGDGEYDVMMTLPFWISTLENGFDNNTKWHTLTIRSTKHPSYDIATGEIRNNPSADPDANNVFAFTGDAFNGFKIYNGAAGENMRLYVTNTNNQHCTFTPEGATFGLYHNTNNGYQFKLVGNNTAYLNDLGGGGSANPLGVWSDSGAATDGGSTFIFSDVVDMPVYTIIYHIKDADGNVIDTQTHHAVTGARFPAVNSASGSEFFEIPEGTVTEDGEYDVAMNPLPFNTTVVTEGYFLDGTSWYKLTVGNRQAAYNATSGKVDNSTTPSSDTNANNVFAFTGDLFHGFKIYNAAVGADKSLHVANTNDQQCTFTAAGATFGLYKHTETGYQFKLVDNYTAYLNDPGDDAEVNQLKIWIHDQSATNAGSIFTFTEASPAVRTITYHIKYNTTDDGDLNTQSHNVVIGSPFPAVQSGASASMFFNTDNIPATPVTADMAGDYTVTIKDLPFQLSTIGEHFNSDTKWYTLKVRGNKHLVYDAATGKVSNNTTEPSENDAYNVFAFTGDPFHGFKIYNGVAGADKQLYVTDTNNQQCTFSEEGTAFGLYKNNATGYQFKLVGSNTTHLNDISNHLGVWTATASASDGGGTFEFTGGPIELPVYTVTYNFENSEGQSAGLEPQTQYVVKGAPYAVRTVSASSFFTIKDIPEGGKVLENGTYTVTTEELPFSTSTIGEHFDSNTKWHTLTIRDKYPLYNALSGEIDITTEDAEVNANNVFAFTGNLLDGFKIYNAASGVDKKLYVTDTNNDRCTFTEDGATFGLYKHSDKYLFKLTGTEHVYLHDITANGVLSVWSDANAAEDDGSKFTFTEVEFDATGTVAIAKENLKAIIAVLEPQLGTDPGYFPNTQDNIDKINVAKGVSEASSSANEKGVNDQIAILNGILQAGRIMPEAGKFYQIINASPNFEEKQQKKKAMYSDGSHVKWGNWAEEPADGTLAGDDRKQIWSIEPKEDGTGYVIRNYTDGKYPTGTNVTNRAFTVETEEAVTVLEYLDAPDAYGQFNVKISGYPAHAGGHDKGAGPTGDIVNYSGGVNDYSAWYIHEVKEPAQKIIHDVAYNYTVDGETKRTIKSVYDATNSSALPSTFDFVTVGELIIDEENKTITVPCTYHDIPFTYSDSYANITTWYAIDMHSNMGAYTWTYVADATHNVQLPITSNDDLQSGCMPADRRWAFVGDPLNGFKIYNQAAGSGMTLRKPANGDVVSSMSETNDRNIFFLHNATIAHSFALRLDNESDGQYLNHNTADGVNVLRGYANADQGSSCRVFELDVNTDIRKNTFYRIKGGFSNHYISAGTSGLVPMVDNKLGENEAKTIYYLDGERKLLNYSNGLYIYETYSTGAIGQANTWGIIEDGDKLMFIADPIGYSRYLYDGGSTINRNGSDDAAHCRWTVESVETLPVTVSGAARWGTFCAPVSLNIPAGVEAYYASSDNNSEADYIYMTKLEGGNIPAGLPVLISNVNDTDVDGDKTYQFAIRTEAAAAVTNQNPQWLGTPAGKISVTPSTTYMLSLKDNKVAFRKNATEVVRGFKAYLQPVNTTSLESFSIRFDEFVTDIQSVKARDMEKTEYYDLSGRRVYFPTRGIYVTNRGEKVFIK